MTVARQVTRMVGLLTVVVAVTDVTVITLAGRLADRVYVGVAACIAVTTTALAILVARRRPTNLVAPLLSWMGLLAGLVAFSDTYVPARSRDPRSLPHLPDVVSALLSVTWIWLYVAVALLMLVFPDGRLAGRRWHWIAAGLPAVGLATQVVMVMSPGAYDAPYAAVRHPFGDLPEGAAVGAKVVLFPALALLLIACAVSLRVRFKRGDDTRRAQLKWLALAALAIPLTVLLSWVGLLLEGTHDLALIGFAILYIAVPVATTIAIVRHDLYDVDRALSAAVTSSAVAAVLLGLFTVASFGPVSRSGATRPSLPQR